MGGVIARKIVRGNEQFVFRNEQGIPEWSGAPGSAEPPKSEHQH
jgi:hypothetical protein